MQPVNPVIRFRPRVILTSVNQVLNLVKSYPVVMSFPVFSARQQDINYLSSTPAKPAGTGCGCKKKNLSIHEQEEANKYSQARSRVEGIWNNIDADQLNKIKAVLQTNEICYYIKKDGRLTLNCI